jgi:hypothetical protein
MAAFVVATPEKPPIKYITRDIVIATAKLLFLNFKLTTDMPIVNKQVIPALIIIRTIMEMMRIMNYKRYQ